MMGTDGSAPTMPWGRLRQLMSSEFIGVEGNWSGNYGHYSNPRIDELIALIPTETDEAKLREYYTEAVEIYSPTFRPLPSCIGQHCLTRSTECVDKLSRAG